MSDSLFLNRQKTFEEIGSILQIPDFFFCIREQWGSDSENYRQGIRQGICDFLKKREILSKEDEQRLLDLKILPKHPNYQFSISHSNKWGGFIGGCGSGSLGFDIEIADRVKDIHVRRVSTEQEVREAPSPGALWVAKEAAFKAFSEQFSLSLLSEIEVRQWERREDINFFSLLIIKEKKIPLSSYGGIVVQGGENLFSIFHGEGELFI